MPVSDPHLEVEASWLAAGAPSVIGCDEVGRGAIAGPVCVGMAVVDAGSGAFPVGLRDSKLLSEKRREAIVDAVRAWTRLHAVGEATAREVDEHGIMAALGLAGKRALLSLHEQGADVAGATILLDGNADWLSPALVSPLSVVTRIKADRDCASVAAASVIAKVHRDRIMIDADAAVPGFGWAGNKGYGSAAHREAIALLGPSELHRRTWLHA